MEVQPLDQLAESTGRILAARGLRLVTAESCTGGWIAKVVTDVPGASGWFERGFVTYTNQAKEEMLGVDPQFIDRHGAVSLPVVMAMATGALVHSHAQVAVAVSGIAGPTGGTPEKPVGTVCFGWARGAHFRWADRQHFKGDREAIRRQSVARALQGIEALLLGWRKA